ncbi:MAG: tetratricopeptide repeat protein [bacterium]
MSNRDIKSLEEKIKLNPKEANPEDVYKVANYYFNNQLLDEALKYYQLLLELNPNHKMGLFELGGIYSNLGNLEEAIKCWQKIISIDPHFTRAHFNLALAYSKLKKYSEALSELQITLSLVRQSGDPIGLEKRIIQEIQRIQNLQTNINNTLLEDIDTQKQYALILLKKGDFNNALNAFKDVIKVKPDDIESLLNIGIILYRNKEFNEAIEYLNKVIEIDENNADAYFYLASCYEELKNLDKAIFYLKIAVNKNPNNYFWYYKLAKILYNLGNYEESIKYFRIAIDLNPLDSYTHNNLGVALLDAGNINEAIKHFLRAVYLDPNDSYSYYNLARCYLKVGQLQRALKNILKAINLESNKAIYYLEAAKIYYKLRNYKDSLNYAIKATELDPNLQDAFLLISKLYIIAKKYNEAIDILNKFIEEEKFEHYLELVNIYLLKENRDSQDLKNALNILYKLYSKKDFINNKKYKGIFLEVLRKIILIHYELSEYEEAYKFIPEFLENIDNSINSYLIITRVLFKLHKYKEIISLLSNINLFTNLVDFKSNNKDSFINNEIKDIIDLLYMYSISLIKIGENENYIYYFKLASEILNRLYSIDNTNKKYIYYYAYCLVRLSNYSKALELLINIENEIISNFNDYYNSIEIYFNLMYNLNNYDELIEKAFYFINNIKNLNNYQLKVIFKYLISSLNKKENYLKIYNLFNYYKHFDFLTIYYILDTLFILRHYYYSFDLDINEVNKNLEEIINYLLQNFDNNLVYIKEQYLNLNIEEFSYFVKSFLFVFVYLFSQNKLDLALNSLNTFINFINSLFNINFYELIFNLKDKNIYLILNNIISKLINNKINDIKNININLNDTEIKELENIYKITINKINLNDILIDIIKVILYYSIYQLNLKSIELILNKYGNYFLIETIILLIKLNLDINNELLKETESKDYVEDLLFNIYLNIEKIKQRKNEIIYKISKKLLDFNIKDWIKKIYLLPVNLIDVNLQDLRLFFFNLLLLDFDNYILNEKWDKIKLDINQETLNLIEKLLYKINEELYNERNRYYILFINSKFKLAKGDIEETITLLSQSINYNIFFYESRLYLGCIYLLRDMHDLALEQFLELANYYDSELLLFLLGKSYLLSKYLKLSKEIFEKLLKINPNNNLYIYHYCLIEIYSGNINAYEIMEKKFIELYKNIIFSNSNLKNNLYYQAIEFSINLVNIYILIKKYDNAVNILTKLIEQNIQREEIYKYLAIIYLATNQVVKALNVYNLGIKNIPNSAELYSNRGVLYYKANKLDLAEMDFIKAYELNKFDFVAKSHLGFINLKKGNYEEAIKYFKEALIIKPFSADVYMSIGTAYEKINKLIEARDNYEMAYEYNQNNPIVIKKLIEIYKKLKDKNRLEIIKEDIEKNNNLDENIKKEILNYIIS